jgi:hypothetical protein
MMVYAVSAGAVRQTVMDRIGRWSRLTLPGRKKGKKDDYHALKPTF